MTKAEKRKATPVATGVLAYFPKALVEISKSSVAGNKQHNGDEPLHWDKNKSTDDLDAGIRHLLDHLGGEEVDDDGVLHLAKFAWRALATLERHLDAKEETKETSDWVELDISGRTWSEVYDEEASDKRMKQIARNGNEGLHYDDISVAVAVPKETPCGWNNASKTLEESAVWVADKT